MSGSEREVMQISFSGGRTSGYMAYRLLTEYKDKYDFIVTFANTGREHHKTLEFINNCDKHFGFNTVWLEAVVHHGERKANTHRVVTYETACRDGSVFEEDIKKYGIPNMAFPGCTRDLKLNPMKSYLKSVGLKENKVKTAIGIRNDEVRRVNPKTAASRALVYPLIDIWPTDKQMVLDWWKEQPFDLEIEEFEGNCLCCFKKSIKKQCMQIDKDPTAFDWCREMEDKYLYTGPQEGPRPFFRGNLTTDALFAYHKEIKAAGLSMERLPADENGGCSESCEVYELVSGGII